MEKILLPVGTDPRIGQLMRNGVIVFYAYADGTYVEDADIVRLGQIIHSMDVAGWKIRWRAFCVKMKVNPYIMLYGIREIDVCWDDWKSKQPIDLHEFLSQP